ncbi:MAG: YdeI/OmpD-associated family protein [Cryomorphaceae bacterium]
MNPAVDFFFAKDTQWKPAYGILRQIMLECGLNEALKWGVPCYTFRNGNIVLIHGFKHYCALLFTKGALLNDVEGLLVQQTENVQAARQIRFTSAEDVAAKRAIIKAYTFEAMEVEKAGLKVPMKKTEAFNMPEELSAALRENAALKSAFESLTPGRQRAYILHVGQAKQAKTRIARIEKFTPHILRGKGLNDL